MIDLVHRVSKFDRDFFIDMIGFGAVLLLLPAMYFLARISEKKEQPGPGSFDIHL
jgi:uncharacterized membrane protein (DUF373 family)